MAEWTIRPTGSARPWQSTADTADLAGDVGAPVRGAKRYIGPFASTDPRNSQP
jgi:hypothetical protein